jgi:hypothetical protein
MGPRFGTGLALGIESHFFAPLDLYDAAVVNGDFDGAELESGKRLGDLIEHRAAWAALEGGRGAHIDSKASMDVVMPLTIRECANLKMSSNQLFLFLISR